jgi:hypothetical protein
MLAVNAMQLLDAMHSVDALNATLVAPDLRQEALKDATRYLELWGADSSVALARAGNRGVNCRSGASFP